MMASGGSSARSGKASGHQKDLSSEGVLEGFRPILGSVQTEQVEKGDGGS